MIFVLWMSEKNVFCRRIKKRLFDGDDCVSLARRFLFSFSFFYPKHPETKRMSQSGTKEQVKAFLSGGFVSISIFPLPLPPSFSPLSPPPPPLPSPHPPHSIAYPPQFWRNLPRRCRSPPRFNQSEAPNLH